MSTFEQEWQRRLRAVLAERCSEPVPTNAVVTIEPIEAIPEARGEVSIYLTVRAAADGMFVGMWEIEGDRALDTLVAAVRAVPEETS